LYVGLRLSVSTVLPVPENRVLTRIPGSIQLGFCFCINFPGAFGLLTWFATEWAKCENTDFLTGSNTLMACVITGVREILVTKKKASVEVVAEGEDVSFW
jgi:hypothetical protein